ncbi:DUF1289 domain-containing protein [Pseudomonas sp. sp1636]|uniref:DUF1289 domain-containing protein n=1 Tax=Pseudomonas sp. sp1636 TaxID=3036707 RepID=UPI0025A4F80D|nr:DUF1289 domain-containing protein [Pseudomonas sp. sp1636]MDM8347429.1 DUF1289 domain-containing protein [Pseudomonas sp. sp1636]
MAQERPLASPCVQVCALDDEDICIGCQRNAAEITHWSRMDNAARRQVLRRCHERAQAKGVLLCGSGER